MIDKNEVEKLAKLSRITLTEEEIESLSKEFSQIVDYVSLLQSVDVKEEDELDSHRNIMREDVQPHESGKYTKDLIKEAPETEKNYIKVNKVLSTDK
ncbi:Asp-tRNA(Asn)/Glu-tRNA(Gln) amidotransferase GatCAB subunit C [bacterium]|nr:Asp-tRNA(Asn)/Glu-tRNA(Gln) amidotransferase GatCAB subunit C [bacterium]|tara:strand:- start:1356 stop:1646 length:291 start_codon:yes stop_codon:yes gene_type:complete